MRYKETREPLEARKDDIVAIANLARRCLKLNGKKRPTLKGVSAELEALRKVQSFLQINLDYKSPSDGQSLEYTPNDTTQDSREESISLSLHIESTSL